MAQYSSINSWWSDQEKKIDKTSRAIKIDIANQVIKNTRVDTGRLRGNWIPTNVSPSFGTRSRLDPSGSAGAREVAEVFTGEGVSFLCNNLPYAPVWNEVDGYIDLARARFRSVVEYIARMNR